MIKTATCAQGNVSVKNELAMPRDKKIVSWVFAAEPTEKELEQLSSGFEIKKEIFQRFSRETRSKKYSYTPFCFALVDYYVENSEVKTSHVLFVLKQNALLILVPKRSGYYTELFQRVLDALRTREKTTIGWLLYSFLEEDIEDNYEVLHSTEETLIKIEEEATEFAGQNMPTREIVRFKRSLFKMSRRFWSSAKIMFLLRKGLTPVKIDKESQTSLDNIYDTLIHQIDIVTAQQEMVTDVLTIYATKVSNDISKRVKKLTYITLVLTGITLVLSVPNTIATIFGIPYFPRELGEGIAWEVILLLLVISTAISGYWLYRYWQKHGLQVEKE